MYKEAKELGLDEAYRKLEDFGLQGISEDALNVCLRLLNTVELKSSSYQSLF